VIRHRVNQGLGAAVRSGLTAARAGGADIVVKFDADLQHDPADIAALLAPILGDEADVVYGNRFERLEYAMPWVRRAGNALFTRLMRWLTGWPLRDSQPGIFAVDRAYLEGFYLPGDYNYTQQILLDAYHRGLRFAHVPVAFRRRATGESFVSYRYPFKVLPQIVMVLAGVRPMKVFAPIGLAFLAVALGVFGWELAVWVRGEAARPVENVNLVLGTGLFGLQTLFFGILAELIVRRPRA
jgi:glycosyltransferase involved in cell wall biosynthesis